jgi:hypothetical protein
VGQRRHDLADVPRNRRGGAVPLAQGLATRRTLLRWLLLLRQRRDAN